MIDNCNQMMKQMGNIAAGYARDWNLRGGRQMSAALCFVSRVQSTLTQDVSVSSRFRTIGNSHRFELAADKPNGKRREEYPLQERG